MLSIHALNVKKIIVNYNAIKTIVNSVLVNFINNRLIKT